MSHHGKDLRRLVRDFLSCRESFWGFHEKFLAMWTRLPSDVLGTEEHADWNEIYGWILTSSPEPISEVDAARGVIGEAVLRDRLRRHPCTAPTR